MKRIAVLLVVVVGCQPRGSRPAPEPVPDQRHPVAEPPLPVAPPPATLTDFNFDFAKWPTATKHPISVTPHVQYACGPGVNGVDVPGSTAQTRRWVMFGGERRHGPHFRHYNIIRMNPDAEQEFKKLDAPLPVGTVVVKEKHDTFPKGPPSEFGAMIKRESGYDVEHGDWEYVYVVRGPEEKVTRGRLATCIDCHSHVKHRDYVFRTYLKPEGVSEW